MNIPCDSSPMGKVKPSVLLILVLYVFMAYTYLVLRFDGQFVEVDTAAQTRIIHSASQDNSVLSTDTPYSNGFLYTALSLFMLEVCGMSISTLQNFIYPLTTVFLFFPVFVTYRVYSDRLTVALLATLILFFQPDFIFVTMRGSHERITWALTLLLLFSMAKIVLQNNVQSTGKFVLLFYIFAFALISTNTFFASSFVLGLMLSFAGGLVLLRLRRMGHRATEVLVQVQIQRFFYLATSTLIFWYIFVFYMYPPALEGLNALNYLLDKLLLVLSGVEQAFNPYSTFLSFNWISIPLYLMMMALSMLVLLSSALIWLLQGIPFFRSQSLTPFQTRRLILWLIYAAFGAQLVLAMLSDRTDALTGNMQVRMFTPVMLLAVSFSAAGLWAIMELLARTRRKRVRLAITMVLVLSIGWFSFSSLLKAPIEPTVGNKFLFTTVPEDTAGDWLVNHIASGSLAWTGLDERMVVSMYARHADDLRYESGPFRIMPEPSAKTNYYVLSYIEMLRWVRAGQELPYLEDKNQVYDNGSVQIYHRRPLTIFQR